MGKRKGGYKPGTVGVPGGRIELNEGIEETVSRELQEETGIIPKEFKYVGVVRNDQRESVFVHFVFACTTFEGEPRNMEPDKCEGWDWHSFDDLPSNILPGHKAAIEIYIKKLPLADMY